MPNNWELDPVTKKMFNNVMCKQASKHSQTAIIAAIATLIEAVLSFQTSHHQ
jgi:hypothetical protein